MYSQVINEITVYKLWQAELSSVFNAKTCLKDTRGAVWHVTLVARSGFPHSTETKILRYRDITHNDLWATDPFYM